MSSILMVTSEATPFAKTGGLADVLGALPPALAKQGDRVAVVLPLYTSVKPYLVDAGFAYTKMPVPMGKRTFAVDVRRITKEGVDYLFVDEPTFFDRPNLYMDGAKDYPDNHLRFAFLCYAALGIVRHVFRPDVIHAHDWQAALVAPLMKNRFAGDPTFIGIKTLFTIHNLGYQGLFPAAAYADLGLDPSLFSPAGLEFWGMVNLMKGGIVFSDAISTVSPTYAKEIQTPEYGFGLDGLLRSRASDITGILNGVDYDEWSPEKDRYIEANYSASTLDQKAIDTADLLRAFGLPPENLDRPLIGIVSRFVEQKGFDLIAEVANELAAEDLALVALGNGRPGYEDLFKSLAASYPDRIAVKIGYDNELAHKIEAGSDMFLMPSHYEPCGLNQIYSLRYGTVPVVRATGGLDDTIEEDTGFKFRDYSGQALLSTIRTALRAYQNRQKWLEMMKRGMAKDFSWNASAAQYSALYRRLIG